jgi:hypothetical protein
LDLLLFLVLFDVLFYFLCVATSTSSDDNGVRLEVTAAPGRANQEEVASDVDDGYRDLMFLDASLHNFLDFLSFLGPELNRRILKELSTFLLELIMVHILKHLLQDFDLRPRFSRRIRLVFLTALRCRICLSRVIQD